MTNNDQAIFSDRESSKNSGRSSDKESIGACAPFDADRIADMIAQESLGGPTEDRPLLVGLMIDDLQSQAGLITGLWEALYTDADDEGAKETDSGQSRILEAFIAEVGIVGDDSTRDTSLGVEENRSLDQSVPELDPLDGKGEDLSGAYKEDGVVGKVDWGDDADFQYERNHLFSNEALSADDWMGSKNPQPSDGVLTGLPQDSRQAAPDVYEIEAEVPDGRDVRWSRVLLWIGIATVLLAIVAGYFLLQTDLFLKESDSRRGSDKAAGEVLDDSALLNLRGMEAGRSSQPEGETAKGGVVDEVLAAGVPVVLTGGKEKPSLPKEQDRGKLENKERDASGETRPDAIQSKTAHEETIFSVHVGSFRHQDNANHLLEILEKKGYQVRVEFITLGEKGGWHRVLVGRFSSQDAAATLTEDLIRKEKLPALVLEAKVQ